jgi:DNA-directed RNA polymerase subunit beta'
LPGRKGEGMIFANPEEADLAFHQGIVDLHAKIKVRLPSTRSSRTIKGHDYGAIINTTPGRNRFNMMLPDGMDFYN